MFQRAVGGSGVEEVESVCSGRFGAVSGGGAAGSGSAEEDDQHGEEREENGGGDYGDGYGEELGYVAVVAAAGRLAVGWEDEGGDVGGKSREGSSMGRRRR